MEQERIIQIEKILTKARFQFAIKCLYRLMLTTPKNDIACSPHSIYEGLLSVYFMSSGAIEKSLKFILYLSDIPKYDLIQYYSYTNIYNTLTKNSEQSENNASAASSDYDDERRCWIKSTKFNHLLQLKNIFNNGLEIFHPDSTPTERIDCISIVIQSAEKNQMCYPVELGEVRDDIELVLMTVSRLNTQKFQILNSESDASNVPILHDKRKRRSFFSHGLDMHVIEFPNTNENRSLFVFLPGSINLSDYGIRRFPIADDIICNLIERLSTEDAICTLRNLLDSDSPSEDVIEFSSKIGPVFDLERDMSMRALLRDLGIEELLKPDAINLDSFFVDDIVHLGNAVHRIRVKVTEEDIVADAVTVIYTGQENLRSSMRNNLKYNFPFVWLIYDKQRRNVLFAGAFN